MVHTPETVISFQDVSKRYGFGWFNRSIQALNCISFEVTQGEVLGLVGPNRAGKTTVVKLLMGLARADSGVIERFGRPIGDRSTLSQIGYVHESPAFPRYDSARQLLRSYGQLSGRSCQRIEQALDPTLDRVGLLDRADDSSDCFSRGMLQRLALAQALIHDPLLLVLDEPSEGLDFDGQATLTRILEEHREQGGTVLIISHQAQAIFRLCDRLVFLKNGQCQGIFNRPSISSTQLLVGLNWLRDVQDNLGLALSQDTHT